MPSMLLLVVLLHLIGVAICLFTLGSIWTNQVLTQIVLSRIPFVDLVGGLIPMWILFLFIAAIAIIGVANVILQFRTWWRGESIADAGARLRIGLYVAMGCLCCCVFVLSTPETYSGPFRLRFPIAAWITASLAYGLYCALPKLRFRLTSGTRRRLDVIGMNVTVTLLLAEIVLLIVSVVSANPFLITESSSSQLRRDSERKEPGSLWFSFPMNSGGHYDTEFLPPGERSKPLVVCIGDSFSYGVVPHHYHYTTVAEREFPGAEIYNMGFPGIGPVDYLHLLVEDALPLEPDLVVIALYVGNDVLTRERSAPPNRWYDAQSYMVGIVWHRLQILRRAKSNDWTQDSPDKIDEALVSKYPWLIDPLQEKPSMGPEIFLELESRNAYIGAADHPGVYDRFFAVLRDIENAVGEVPLVFLIIPDEYQVEDDLWQSVVENNDVPLQRDRPQRKIRDWASAGNGDVVDLLPRMLAVEPLPDGRRHVYHLRDTHLNARGNEIAGKTLATFLETWFNSADESGSHANPKSPRVPAAPRPEVVPIGTAVEIVQTYAAAIPKVGIDGSVVVDSSRLPFSKARILGAVTTLISSATDPAERESFVEVALTLAFFQANVGDAPVALDETMSDGDSWRDLVSTEMRNIRQKLDNARR